MGSMSAGWALVFGVVLTLMWLCIGAGAVALVRPNQWTETWSALVNMVLWPLGLLSQKVIWPLIKRRHERERQARISAKVELGEYDPDFARTTLHWKG